MTKRRVEYIRDKISGEGGRKKSRSASAAGAASDEGDAVYDDDDDDEPAVSARTAGSPSAVKKKVSRGAIHGSRSGVGGGTGQGKVSAAAAAGDAAGKLLGEDEEEAEGGGEVGGEAAEVDFMAELRDRFAVVGAEEMASDDDLALLADDALFSQPLPDQVGGDNDDNDEVATASSSLTTPETATATTASAGGGGGGDGALPAGEVVPAAATAAEAHHDGDASSAAADAADMEGEQRGDLDLDPDNGGDANNGGVGEETDAAASDLAEEALLGAEADVESGEGVASPLPADEKQEGDGEKTQEESEVRLMKVRARFAPSYIWICSYEV